MKLCLRAGFLHLSLSDSSDELLVRCMFSALPDLYLLCVDTTQSVIDTKNVSTNWQISLGQIGKILP